MELTETQIVTKILCEEMVLDNGEYWGFTERAVAQSLIQAMTMLEDYKCMNPRCINALSSVGPNACTFCQRKAALLKGWKGEVT